MGKQFVSIDEFYADRPRRTRSGEMDFGVWWFDARQLTFRISAIKDTGEVYSLQQRGADAGRVTVLLAGLPVGEACYDMAEALLEGWADKCGTPSSYEWAVGALARAEVAS